MFNFSFDKFASGLEIADLLSENIILSPPVCLLCQCLSSWNSLCSKRQIRVCCRLVFWCVFSGYSQSQLCPVRMLLSNVRRVLQLLQMCGREVLCHLFLQLHGSLHFLIAVKNMKTRELDRKRYHSKLNCQNLFRIIRTSKRIILKKLNY